MKKSHLGQLVLFFIILPLLYICSEETKLPPYPASASFLIIDLKYNASDGIKICEVQNGSASSYSGDMFVHHGNGEIGQNFGLLSSVLNAHKWFVKGNLNDEYVISHMLQNGWKEAASTDSLLHDAEFKQATQQAVLDPYPIREQSGILYIKYIDPSKIQFFNANFPGIVLVDYYYFPYRDDKIKISRLFDLHPELAQYKPRWGLYPKEYHASLAAQIKTAIPAKRYVIKPANSYKGRGVIIVDQKDLEKTLKYILKRSHKLKNDHDKGYNYWYYSSVSEFIVEEFIPSDPIVASHLKNKSYDPTLRAAALLYTDQGEIKVQFCGAYWKLPKKALSTKESLNKMHKSAGEVPYFAQVAPETWTLIAPQLETAMTLLYQQMLELK